MSSKVLALPMIPFGELIARSWATQGALTPPFLLAADGNALQTTWGGAGDFDRWTAAAQASQRLPGVMVLPAGARPCEFAWPSFPAFEGCMAQVLVHAGEISAEEANQLGRDLLDVGLLRVYMVVAGSSQPRYFTKGRTSS